MRKLPDLEDLSSMIQDETQISEVLLPGAAGWTRKKQSLIDAYYDLVQDQPEAIAFMWIRKDGNVHLQLEHWEEGEENAE